MRKYILCNKKNKEKIEFNNKNEVIMYFGGMVEQALSIFYDDLKKINNMNKISNRNIEELFFDDFIINWNKYCNCDFEAIYDEEGLR